MAQVSPFQGITYATKDGKLDSLISPPYDVLGEEARLQLIQRDPHNVAVIDSPKASAEGADQYVRSASSLRDWLARGVLRQDSRPALYITDHAFGVPGSPNLHRTGVFLLLQALPWEQSDVKRHEVTMAKPRADRLSLLAATKTQTSPIFTAWNGADLREPLSGHMESPVTMSAEIVGDYGQETVRVWRIDEPSAVSAITASLTPAPFYIADGHHRYETAATYAAEAPAERSPQVLSYCCAAGDPGLCVMATHRVISPSARAATIGELRQRLGSTWCFRDADRAEVLSLARDSERNEAALVSPDGIYIASRPRTAEASPRQSLNVTVADEELLPGLDIGADAGNEGKLTFTHDPHAAIDAVQAGDAALAIILPAPTMQDIVAVADAGETMPQKSTYFYPKVPTGLVMWRQG